MLCPASTQTSSSWSASILNNRPVGSISDRLMDQLMINIAQYEKNQFLSPIVSPGHRDMLYSSALPRKIFPGFSGKVLKIYLSSFHVWRQCSPAQINMFHLQIFQMGQLHSDQPMDKLMMPFVITAN